MPISVFELFKVGIGPSSSHTVGPMRIAGDFVRDLHARRLLADVSALEVHLYGSLALTGRGHATDRAVVWGLLGWEPDTVDTAQAELAEAAVRATGRLALLGRHELDFDPARHIVFHPAERLPAHANGMRLQARDRRGRTVAESTGYSVGGGFVMTAEQMAAPAAAPAVAWPRPYASAAELLALCRRHGESIAAVALANEMALRSRADVAAGLDRIERAMMACMNRGLAHDGVLPGGLGLRRRAHALHQALLQRDDSAGPLRELDWVNAFAVAVNEENAAGGQVVTAPTNGAAGVVPAVMRYHQRFCPGATAQSPHIFLLTASAIGSLYKENASISGAEVGCQGEVGVAASMAAAGLAAVLGGSPAQVENAAEIAMEHHLGMTCDPVAGLVQVPCIERNAMGAVKAINAAHLALAGDGSHLVSLDGVIRTMRETGADMSHKYKETSLGGLALNVVAC